MASKRLNTSRRYKHSFEKNEPLNRIPGGHGKAVDHLYRDQPLELELKPAPLVHPVHARGGGRCGRDDRRQTKDYLLGCFAAAQEVRAG